MSAHLGLFVACVAYDQSMFRTMVFKRLQEDFIVIDGVTYEVSNSANQDHFDCKEKFLNIFQMLEQYYDDDALSPDTLQAFKKELISKLKEFERKYTKHCKTTNPLLAAIHAQSMKPLTDLMEASVNLQNFRTLSLNQTFPEFRKKALEEKFVEFLSGVCKILKAFPNAEGKTLDEEYDIRHILDLLAIERWEEIPPFKHYLDPLKAAYDDLVNELRAMHKLGPLRSSYYIERNIKMSQKIITLVHQYNIVKRIMGDELKRDQFQFLYNVHLTVYDSALKDIYLNSKQHQQVMESVVPELTTFKAMLLIRDIDDRKAFDIERKKKKKEERAALGLSEEESEELVLDIPQPETKKKGKKKVEIDPEIIEQARQVALYKKELETYGVSFCAHHKLASHFSKKRLVSYWSLE